MTTAFSVNVNKFALVRNSRGANTPDLAAIAKQILDRGAQGITIHPRPDQRHARYDDMPILNALVRGYAEAEFNVEGYPCDDFMTHVKTVKPHQVTLVPDDPNQLTSDHGWNCRDNMGQLKEVVAELQAEGLRVSLFLDPDPEQVAFAAETGADRIELYTEGYAHRYATDPSTSVTDYAATAAAAQEVGLGVNAGHDLSLDNLAFFLENVPNVLEVSIGHALVCESWQLGIDETVTRYLSITK
ncbi:MAG: pyridoxine 5'-phosphate synthase [Planctomycetota bacterium]|jgi:pyridoxine 5-phosphate synthase